MKINLPKPSGIVSDTTAPVARAAPVAPAGYRVSSRQVILGHIGMSIDQHGTWHFQGSPIERKALVKLFSTVLHRDENGDHWLITPAEIAKIDVADAPFMAVSMSRNNPGLDQTITLHTNMETPVRVDKTHPSRFDHNPKSGEPSPYVCMDKGLEARLTRSVFYELVDVGTEHICHDVLMFGVWSCGAFFPIDRAPEN